MKVLLLNGSHHQNGNTALALEEAAKALEAEGVETELFQIGAGAIQDCIDCGKCTEKGCIFTGDPVNAFKSKGSRRVYLWHACLLCPSYGARPVLFGPRLSCRKRHLSPKARGEHCRGKTGRHDGEH